MHFRERIIKDTIMYSVANYIAMGIGIFLSIVTKGILGPLGAGYFAMIKVFSSYGAFSDMGSRDAMLREVAQAVGAGKEEAAARTRDSVFTFTMLSAAGVILVFWVIACFFVKDPVMKTGVFLAGFLVLATQLYNFTLTFMRVLKDVSHLSITVVVNILGVALFSILGAYFWGVLGLIVGLTITTFLSAYFAYRLSGMKLRLRWDPEETGRLIKIGFPLVLAGYALDTFLCADTIMIGKMIGYNQLGFYTIALMSIQQINSLGRFAQIILLPHIQEKYGKTGNLADSKPLFVKTTTTLVYFLPVIIGLVFFGVPVIVHYFLPKFSLGLAAMRILVTAYYFVAVNEMSSTVLFTINKQVRLIPIFASMILLAIGLNYVFIKAQGGIEGVALATTIAYVGYFAVVFTYAFRHLMENTELRRTVLFVLGIFAYMSVLLHGIEAVVRLASPLISALAKLAIFLVCFSPVLAYYEKQEGVLKSVGSIIVRKWKGVFCATV